MVAQDADDVIEQALKQSIEKWRRIVYHGKLDMSSSDCAHVPKSLGTGNETSPTTGG